LEWRERVRLYKTLLDQRNMWIQRIHAELFQHGVSLPEAGIDSVKRTDLGGGPHPRVEVCPPQCRNWRRRGQTSGLVRLAAARSVRLSACATLGRGPTSLGRLLRQPADRVKVIESL